MSARTRILKYLSKICKNPLKNRTRFLLLPLVTLCLMINWANILTFNFTVICMSSNSEENNSTTYVKPDGIASNSYDFTQNQKSVIMVVCAAGALVAGLPIMYLVNRFGPRHLFTTLGLLSAFATGMTPLAIYWGYGWFLVARILQGIAFAGDMATFGSFMNSWVFYKQKALFTAALCVYVQLAPVFTNPISGVLCTSNVGWPGVYYVHSGVTVFLFMLFFIFYRNHPEEHFGVSKEECQKIARENLGTKVDKIPFKAILTSMPFWAVFVGGIGNFTAINLMYQFSPTYLKNMQGYNESQTGFFAAIPPLLEAFFKEINGVINDRIKCVNETTKTKIYNTLAFGLFSLFIVILSFVPSGQGITALILMTAAVTLCGFNIGGFYKSGSLISGPYAPFVLGQVSTGLTATLLIVPCIVNPLIVNNTREEWALVFYIMAGIIIACNIFYVIFASGEPCEWAKPKSEKQNIDINGNIGNWSAKFDHGSGKIRISNNGNKIFPSEIEIIQSKNGLQYEASTIPSKWNKTTPKSPKKFIIMPSSLSKNFDHNDDNSNVSHNGTTIMIMDDDDPIAKSIMHNSNGVR